MSNTLSKDEGEPQAKAVPVLQKLVSYIPSMLVNIMNDEEGLTLMSKTGWSIVMQSNIWGFSSLSENFCSAGAIGIDELSELTSVHGQVNLYRCRIWWRYPSLRW